MYIPVYHTNRRSIENMIMHGRESPDGYGPLKIVTALLNLELLLNCVTVYVKILKWALYMIRNNLTRSYCWKMMSLLPRHQRG